MAEIVEIVKEGVIQYPITKPEAVIDEKGKNVLQLIKENSSSYDDTEIWAELTELSAEVSGLSERIDNLPSGESEVFKAVYGETTYEEVVAAYDSGKVVHCDYDNHCYGLSQFTGTTAWFSALNVTTNYMLTVGKNGWGIANYTLENTGNRKKVINAESTDESYPTCKAVYDFVQSQGGGGGGMTTPSGDPMHYAYVEAGAEYNDTGADITRTGEYGDTILWKAGYWWLNELGDITNDQMRAIFVHWQKIMCSYCYYKSQIRTNLPFVTRNTNISSDTRAMLSDIAFSTKMEVFNWNTLGNPYDSQLYIGNLFIYSYSLKKILGIINANTIVEFSLSCFETGAIQEVRIAALKVKCNFGSCSKLSYDSISYMIANSAATKAITLTLHATALANAEAAYLEDTTQDLATYPTLSDWALSKNIQIATA